MPRRHRLRLRAPREAEDLLAGWLWARGTEGLTLEIEPATESAIAEVDANGPGATASAGWILVEATFQEEKLLVKEEMADLEAWIPGVTLVDSGLVEDRDWLAVWRASAQVFPLGEKLAVDPREWSEAAQPPSETPAESSIAEGGTEVAGGQVRRVLQIPARTAFGVGSHESTRLAYELLEATDLAGRRVLDVGCGSGILAMAALALGALSAVGFDLDLGAALLAGQYARHNRLAPRLFAGTVAALAPPPAARGAFDVVVLNVLPHEIAGELDRVVAQLAPGGDLLVSGVLASEADRVRRAVGDLGCDERRRVTAGEWIGLGFASGARARATAPAGAAR
ncbi:MAG: 50S ribosomal protein L11 methyltransferase [Thermoanaerobaculia bacterium]